MKTSTASLADLSRMAGKKPPNVLKALRRAGVRKNKDGRYNAATALDVLAEGTRQDKSKQEEQLRSMEQRGIGDNNLLYKAKVASIRRVMIQGDILEIERDKARGTLVSVDELKAQVQSTANLLMILVERFIENVSAKRRDAELEIELRDCFDRARRQLLDEADTAGR